MSPKLDVSVYYSESESSYGTFGLGIKLANNGLTKATNIEYYLVITGSSGIPIAYTVSYSHSDIVTSIDGLKSAYTSIIGSGDVYVPYAFDCEISWNDENGKQYGPVAVTGSFNVDNSLSMVPSSREEVLGTLGSLSKAMIPSD